MANKDLINLGITPDSGTGDSARLGGTKINTLFADIYSRFGDLAVDNDNTSATYGQRPPLDQYEYKVGELHPAGRPRRIVFYDDSDGAWYFDQVTQRQVRYQLFNAQTGWNDSFPTYNIDNVEIPALYLKKNWYFMSRGEVIIADLSYVTDSDVHIVLPLARVGDVCVIRDAFGALSGNRAINVWASPYKFLPYRPTPSSNPEWGTVPQAARDFFENTPGFKEAGGTANDSEIQNTTQVRSSLTLNVNSCYTNYGEFTGGAAFLNFRYTGTDTGNALPGAQFVAPWSNIELTFLGPQLGWVSRVTSLEPAAGQPAAPLPITINMGSWVQSSVDVKGTTGDADEVVIPAGWYYYAINNATRDTANSLFQVYREVATHNTNNDDFIEQMSRMPAGSPLRTWQTTSGVGTAPFYKRIDITSVIDDRGNILLVSQTPFNGIMKFLIFTS